MACKLSFVLILIIMHCNCIMSNLNIPTFSIETDWESQETSNKLSFAVEYGFSFFEMTQNDQDLYELIYPTILSFFHDTADWSTDYLPNQDLNFSIWREKDIFYGYFNYQTIKPYQQCRCFMIPIQSTPIDVLNHSSNPFKNDKNVLKFANSVINHAMKVLYHIIRYILNKMDINHNNETCIDYFNQLIGNNPATHFGINYFNANELNDKIKHGMVDHTDSGFIAMLVLSKSGLQIKYENEWIDIDYYPNKMIINFGTMMELLSNGIVKAVNHKVKIIENGERLSFGIFLNGDIDGNVYKFENNTLKPIKTVLQHFQESFDEYL